TAGRTTANASASLTVGGVSLTRDTNPATANVGAGPGGSGPAVKTWVDANITITPSPATNEVGVSHTFTVTVKKDLGDGAGLVAAAGETVNTTIANTLGASGHMTGGTCGAASGLSGTGTTNASGQCTIVITSADAGKTTANASVTLVVGGVTLTRDTNPATANIGAGPGGSGPAVKTWVDANITITP